jgi:hypothetical protein
MCHRCPLAELALSRKFAVQDGRTGKGEDHHVGRLPSVEQGDSKVSMEFLVDWMGWSFHARSVSRRTGEGQAFVDEKVFIFQA